jgi:hypothetical protein
MKIIDQTPFFSADGKISVVDKARATMKFGATWIQETQAQAAIIPLLDRGLEKKYTLLRNVKLAGLEIIIPLILVGPAGVYAMYATSLRGMYRAKGDQWGTISGDNLKPASVNLLTRTARMARAVQVYFQRQGHELPCMVEAVLLCADPGMHVDSVRPIIRVVQYDAIDRFAMAVSQSRAVMDSSIVLNIVERILNPKPPAAAQAAPTPPTPEPAAPEEEPYVPSFAQPGYQEPQPASKQTPTAPFQAGTFDFSFQDDGRSENETLFTAPSSAPVAPAVPGSPLGAASAAPRPQVRKSRGLSKRQLFLLAGMGVVELIILIIMFFMVIKNLY